MKNFVKMAGIIAFVTVIGFSFITCDAFGKPEITISGTAKVGEKITAKVSHGDYDFVSNYYWQFSDNKNSYNWDEYYIDGGSGSKNEVNTIQSVREGLYIRARREYKESGDIYSNVLGPIQPAD